jgi:hypothetical protein
VTATVAVQGARQCNLVHCSVIHSAPENTLRPSGNAKKSTTHPQANQGKPSNTKGMLLSAISTERNLPAGLVTQSEIGQTQSRAQTSKPLTEASNPQYYLSQGSRQYMPGMTVQLTKLVLGTHKGVPQSNCRVVRSLQHCQHICISCGEPALSCAQLPCFLVKRSHAPICLYSTWEAPWQACPICQAHTYMYAHAA